MKGIPEVHHAH